MDRDFIAERQRGLQAYLDSVTQHPLLSSSLLVKKFLDPNSYSANYTGRAAADRSALTHTLRYSKYICSLIFSRFLQKKNVVIP